MHEPTTFSGTLDLLIWSGVLRLPDRGFRMLVPFQEVQDWAVRSCYRVLPGVNRDLKRVCVCLVTTSRRSVFEIVGLVAT